MNNEEIKNLESYIISRDVCTTEIETMNALGLQGSGIDKMAVNDALANLGTLIVCKQDLGQGRTWTYRAK